MAIAFTFTFTAIPTEQSFSLFVANTTVIAIHCSKLHRTFKSMPLYSAYTDRQSLD